ncbi:hypothetical protein E4U58_000368 [Claviceps cyperi]|nr:hypothetical protein E4U58_000368 [Claviceps cyperi]
MLERLQREEPPTRELIHPRWWLHEPSDIADHISQIRDPAIIGRTRTANHKKDTSSQTPSQSQRPHPQDSQLPQSLQSSQPPQPPLPPSSQLSTTQGAPRQLKSSIRRSLSQWEVGIAAVSRQHRRAKKTTARRSAYSSNIMVDVTRGSQPLSSSFEGVIPATQLPAGIQLQWQPPVPRNN